MTNLFVSIYLKLVLNICIIIFYYLLSVVSVPVSSPPGNLSTLQGMSSSLQALRPQGPSITPSLANHYRDDLVNHVRGWPAEILEKQVSNQRSYFRYTGRSFNSDDYISVAWNYKGCFAVLS